MGSSRTRLDSGTASSVSSSGLLVMVAATLPTTTMSPPPCTQLPPPSQNQLWLPPQWSSTLCRNMSRLLWRPQFIPRDRLRRLKKQFQNPSVFAKTPSPLHLLQKYHRTPSPSTTSQKSFPWVV